MNAVDFKKLLQVFCIVLGAVFGFLSTAGAKPTISLSLPQRMQGIPMLASFTNEILENRETRKTKNFRYHRDGINAVALRYRNNIYIPKMLDIISLVPILSGRRLRNDSLLMIYRHDCTIAVTELGPEKLLLGCELVEIYNENEAKVLLKDLSKYNKPLEISLKEMIKLMMQCETVDKATRVSRSNGKSIEATTSTSSKSVANSLGVNIFPQSPLTLLRGIIPGTKWCGTGDIADNYSDLGAETNMDRCCRQHDFCPVKIGSFRRKYDLTNESVYTKSHCICDDMLNSCLKQTNTSASLVMGSFYFNFVQVACLSGDNLKYQYRAAKEF